MALTRIRRTRSRGIGESCTDRSGWSAGKFRQTAFDFQCLHLAVGPNEFRLIPLQLSTLTLCLPARAVFLHDTALQGCLRIDAKLSLAVCQMLLCLLQARIRLLAGAQVDGFLLFQQMFRMCRATLRLDLSKAIICLCDRMQCIGSHALYGQLHQAKRSHRQDS